MKLVYLDQNHWIELTRTKIGKVTTRDISSVPSALLIGLPRLRRALMPVSESPFAEMLPRLFELKEALPDPTHPDAYFQHFEERIESDHVRSLYLRVERALGLLDVTASTGAANSFSRSA